jgi:hypothetical protein
MLEKDHFITSLVEMLEKNPLYKQLFEFRGNNAVMSLELSNILCQTHDLSVWIDACAWTSLFSINLVSFRNIFQEICQK